MQGKYEKTFISSNYHKENDMKTRRLLALAIVAWLCCAGISAQVAYPKDMFAEEMAFQVKYKGAQPTITDFISSYFDSDEEWPEIWGTCRDAWKAHIAGNVLRKGAIFFLTPRMASCNSPRT